MRMKRVIKYVLLLLLILTITSIANHDHTFIRISNEERICEIGYAEYICDCGYVYKDCCTNLFRCQNADKIEKEVEEEKSRNKALIFTIKINEVILKLNSCKEKTILCIDFPIIEKEKVYIIFSKFQGSL